MKLSVDHKRVHLRFFIGFGFALLVLVKIVKKKDPEAAATVKTLSKQLKKLLKGYKRAYGSLQLLEVEDKHSSRISIKF